MDSCSPCPSGTPLTHCSWTHTGQAGMPNSPRRSVFAIYLTSEVNGLFSTQICLPKGKRLKCNILGFVLFCFVLNFKSKWFILGNKSGKALVSFLWSYIQGAERALVQAVVEAVRLLPQPAVLQHGRHLELLPGHSSLREPLWGSCMLPLSSQASGWHTQ